MADLQLSVPFIYSCDGTGRVEGEYGEELRMLNLSRHLFSARNGVERGGAKVRVLHLSSAYMSIHSPLVSSCMPNPLCQESTNAPIMFTFTRDR